MYVQFKNSIKSVIMTMLLSLALVGCATTHHIDPCHLSIKSLEELQQGKRYFETGYYKRALCMLLPLACDGVPEAEYAIGYMFYYGYGVAQDTTVGSIWIHRAADKGYPPAIHALNLIRKDRPEFRRVTRKLP